MFVNPRESESKSPSAQAFYVLSEIFNVDALLLHLLFPTCGLGREHVFNIVKTAPTHNLQRDELMLISHI